MPPRINTINLVSRDNGVGLTTDMDLLQAMFEEAGYDVERVSWQARRMRRCDVAVFLELFSPVLVRHARRTIGIFNLEWFLPRWRAYLPRITQLWAKSADAHEAFLNLRLRSHLTGFLARDLYDPSVTRTPTCLHLKGHSDLKNTPAILEAWARNPDLPPLTIITQTPIPHPPPGVTVLPRLEYPDLVRQMNTHQIHLCPSRAEGWGHYITEGLSTGAAVVTTDAPPMNEHITPGGGWLLPSVASHPRQWVYEHDVDPKHIADAVRQAVALTPEQRAEVSHRARTNVANRNAQFRHIALTLLERL